jgi:hypothetical protein
MNLNEKNCKYCGEIVKKFANRCIHCGELLDIQLPTQGYPSMQNAAREIKSGGISGSFFTVIVGVVIFGLAMTNPSKTDFKNFINEKISSKVDKELSKDNTLGSSKELISGFVKGIANIAVEGMINRENFFIFSTYEVDTSFLKALNQDIPEMKFLGVANSFIPLSKSVLAKSDNETSPKIAVEEKPIVKEEIIVEKKIEPVEEVVEVVKPKLVLKVSPSFDCTKATLIVEQTICNNPELAKLDVRNAEIFKRALDANPEKARHILRVSNQDRRQCKDDISCINANYLESIANYNLVMKYQ